MQNDTFTGDKKEPLVSFTARHERRFIDAHVHRVPPWLGSQHLTLMTIIWSGGVLLAALLAARVSIHFLWFSSLFIVLQWLTDCFDGTVGRLRNQGLKRWGFFMDHYLDYLFMACVTGQYALLVPDPGRTLCLVLIPLYAGFEINSWLEYGATNKFRITYGYAGPTEARLFFIALNTALIIFGTVWFQSALPYFMAHIAAILIATVYRTQQRIWAMDMAAKAEAEFKSGGRNCSSALRAESPQGSAR